MDGKEIRRQYFCICAGQQEEMYLRHLSCLLKIDKRRITFAIKQGLPWDIIKQNHIQYDKAVLFDHDGETEAFRKALKACIKSKCIHAYSYLNFDLWLLLHKRAFTRCESDNRAYVNDIRVAYKLDIEADIKSEAILERILKQISLSDVKSAIHRAKRIREQKLQGDGKQIGRIIYYDNPDLSIHEFITKVLSECEEVV
jgi:hypothetical protein